MIWENTGAATVPPKIGVGWSRTTMAENTGLLGRGAARRRWPCRPLSCSCPCPVVGIWAVPVLPGDRVAGTDALVPVPLFDDLLEHCGQLGVGRRRDDPVGLRRCGRRHRAVGADRRPHQLRRRRRPRRWPRRCRRRAPGAGSPRRPGRSGARRSWSAPTVSAPAISPSDSPGKFEPGRARRSRAPSPGPAAVSPRGPGRSPTVPMFDDWARIWVAVSCSVGCVSASWNVEPSSVIWSGTVNVVFGLISPSWRAAEKVTSLKTDPGS